VVVDDSTKRKVRRERQLSKRPDFCDGCPIGHVTTGYVPPQYGTGNELWVGDKPSGTDAAEGKPFVGGAGPWLNSLLKVSKISRTSLNVVNAIGCACPSNIHPLDREWVWTSRETARAGVEYCQRNHLQPVIDKKKWTRIVSLGEHTLPTLTPRSGLQLWRGSALPLRGRMNEGVRVMPTYHPDYVMRDANVFTEVSRDLRKPLTLPPENYNLYPSINDVRAFDSTEVSFDFEWDYSGNVTLCGLSGRAHEALVVAWCEPYITEVRRILESAKVLIGHNLIGAELSYIQKWGWDISRAELVDTMLLHHLVQPNARHSLAYVASVFTNKVFWKGKGEEQEDDNGQFTGGGSQWKTWNSPEAIPVGSGGYGGCRDGDEAFRLYNARDTDGTLQCVQPLTNAIRKYGLERVYRNVSIPVAYLCADMAEAGLKVDNARVVGLRDEITSKIAELEVQLPNGLLPYEEPCTIQVAAPPNTYKPKTKKCKGKKKLGTAHDSVDVLFTSPGIVNCPVCGVGIDSGTLSECKVVRVPSTKRIVPWNSNDQVLEYARTLNVNLDLKTKSGRTAADKKARKVWGREHVEFTLVDHLKKLNTQKNSFAKPGLKYVERVYFNLLPHGTSEGRLASSGRRRGQIVYDKVGNPIFEGKDMVTVTDPNIQNQPKMIRKLFLPDQPDWGILDLDIVQGENRITAYLAKDFERLERLNTEGYDEHSDLASRCFKRSVEKGGPYEYLRQIGKKINHARNYGMGVNKMQAELALEGYNYTRTDVADMIEEWKKMNAGTAKWQDETIALAQRQGYLVNAFGRKLWFSSRDFGTKALAFLPASTLADCMLRAMIAIHANRFERECFELGLSRVCVLPEPWRLAVQVHDSLVLMGPHETHQQVAGMVADVMTQPWRELEGYSLGVDLSYSGCGGSWGDSKGMKLAA
jgi:uracil-DNA glycosylase family 4